MRKDEKLSDLGVTLEHVGSALDEVNKMNWYKDRGNKLKEAGDLLNKAYALIRDIRDKEDR